MLKDEIERKKSNNKKKKNTQSQPVKLVIRVMRT
jgi:uncharacterized small protein (DUF1192 family)